MNIKEIITGRMQEYESAYMSALANANANNGAMLAMRQLLEDIEKENLNNESKADEDGSDSRD